MVKKIIVKNSGLYKVSGKIDGISYFTVLTKKEKNGENLMYSPNKEYIFKIGNKIDKNSLIPCAMSIHLENYEIIEAIELPQKEKFNILLKNDIEDFKTAMKQMIENNPELYDDVEMEK